MALDFPAGPSNGQTFTNNSTTWTWDGTKWSIITGGGGGGGTGSSIVQGNTTASVVDTGSDGRFVVTTEGSERLRVDPNGRLLVGTSSSIRSNAVLQVYKASGTIEAFSKSNSLSNGDSVGIYAEGNPGAASIGVYKHASITNSCGFLGLRTEDVSDNYLWVDNSDVLRISLFQSHIGTTSGTVVGTQTSDERLKIILGPLNYGLDTVKQLETVRYKLKSEPETEKLGFVAQQVLPLIPESVFDTKNPIEGEPEDAPTKLGMEYVALIPVLVNAIKELSDKNDALEANNASIEARLAALEGGTN